MDVELEAVAEFEIGLLLHFLQISALLLHFLLARSRQPH
jgi:hypothetical protein